MSDSTVLAFVFLVEMWAGKSLNGKRGAEWLWRARVATDFVVLRMKGIWTTMHQQSVRTHHATRI